jgi:hypothetical protein
VVKSRNMLTRDLSVSTGPEVLQGTLYVLGKTVETLLLVQTSQTGGAVFVDELGHSVSRQVGKRVLLLHRTNLILIGLTACTMCESTLTTKSKNSA